LVWEKYYSNGKLPKHTLKGSFWWKDILRLLSKFKEMSSALAFRGDSCFLWKDKWHTPILDQAFPELMSFAKNKNITIFKAKEALSLNELFNLPLSEEAFNQLLELAQILEDLPSLDQDDIWTYDWATPFYIPMKAYVCLIGSRTVHPAFHWLWKSSTQKKHKVFFWLLLKDRVSTRNILRRKNHALPSFDCVLCQAAPEETVEHLFLHCPFAQSCWALLQL
jgi:hypothetical protein